jgi:hypothetical protein
MVNHFNGVVVAAIVMVVREGLFRYNGFFENVSTVFVG